VVDIVRNMRMLESIVMVDRRMVQKPELFPSGRIDLCTLRDSD